ncbi:chorismate mutase [Dacryopinax primogenitus]|uniref:Chorismate mutase n=1 Tax=Dacryopinax primogenitus (strain DJM 731) TaxID=1858805 RepID=M5G2X2_DACPD|nr:chorismate mutase [Dacryopinax primogenitus]EJU03044.1 chorismate mutase [Dacryopinax primogenitus]
MAQTNLLSADPLSLETIRGTLIRLEETIIFSLIERGQFALNPTIYQKGAVAQLKELGFQGSWLEWFLAEIESFHAKARRYTSPDEYPFTSNLPAPLLPPLQFPTIFHPNTVNVNPTILNFYIHFILPRITANATQALAAKKRAEGVQGAAEWEDDGNWGSAATVDVSVLQAISKRVHYGKFVSESKFRSKPSAFIPHIQAGNRQALEDLITKPEVERALLHRLRKKASLYGQEIGPDGEPLVNGKNGVNGTNGHAENEKAKAKIDADVVVEIYESWLIPLTKEVEVDYLLQRLDGLSEKEIEAFMSQPAK